MGSERKLLYADEVKAAIDRAFGSVTPLSRLAYKILCQRSIDALPAANTREPQMIHSSEKVTLPTGESVVIYWTEPEGTPLRAGIAIQAKGFCIAAQGKAESMALFGGLPVGGERSGPERPPMLLVTLNKGWQPEWWIRHLDVWRLTNGAETRSKYIYEVDRTASDAEALRLFDADVAASGR